MYPQSFVREHPDELRAGLVARNLDPAPVNELLKLDRRWLEVGAKVNEARARRNKAADGARGGPDTSETTARRAELGQLRDQIRTMESELNQLEAEIEVRLRALPQIPHASVPPGKTPAENVEVAKHTPDRPAPVHPKPHFEIGPELNLLDEPRGVKVAGEGFYVLWSDLARLQRALVRFMLELHRSRGYTEVAPPILVNSTSLIGTGQLPKFAEDLYQVPTDGMWLVPTAEVPVTNLFRDEVLLAEDLPCKLVAYTPCFRREAGGHGVETRGIARVHQFDKVELVKFTTPESSYDEHESLRADAEEVVRRLELPYRVLNLCAGDLPEKAAKCYDIELWAPGVERWLEVSSISNFEAYQAARANLRFRSSQAEKPRLLHTLNASGTALPRLLVAILENYQTADGRVEIPTVLRPEFGGERYLNPNPFIGEQELGRGRHSQRNRPRSPADAGAAVPAAGR